MLTIKLHINTIIWLYLLMISEITEVSIQKIIMRNIWRISIGPFRLSLTSKLQANKTFPQEVWKTDIYSDGSWGYIEHTLSMYIIIAMFHSYIKCLISWGVITAKVFIKMSSFFDSWWCGCFCISKTVLWVL